MSREKGCRIVCAPHKYKAIILLQMNLSRSVFKRLKFSLDAWPGVPFAIDIKTGYVVDKGFL